MIGLSEQNNGFQQKPAKVVFVMEKVYNVLSINRKIVHGIVPRFSGNVWNSVEPRLNRKCVGLFRTIADEVFDACARAYHNQDKISLIPIPIEQFLKFKLRGTIFSRPFNHFRSVFITFYHILGISL